METNEKYDSKMCHSTIKKIVDSYNEYNNSHDNNIELCNAGIKENEDTNHINSILKSMGF